MGCSNESRSYLRPLDKEAGTSCPAKRKAPATGGWIECDDSSDGEPEEEEEAAIGAGHA